MSKYFQIHSEQYSKENFISYEDDFWINEEKFKLWFNELQFELKDEELTGEFSTRFCAEQYYGDSKEMFEKYQCSQVFKIDNEDYEKELIKLNIHLWMVKEISKEEYFKQVQK